MLVLTRKAEESIRIGDDITVTILSIDGERVRVGIDAPRSIRVYREELLKQTRDVNQESVSVPVLSNEALEQALRKTAETLGVKPAEPPVEEKTEPESGV